MEEVIEIIENPDGTSSIKVVSSKRPCKEVSRPFEQAKGVVTSTKSIHNPGTQQGTQIKQ
jgi:hypothetical protein